MYTVLAISIRTHSNGEQRYIPEQLETAKSHSTPAAVLASTTLRKQNINGIMILHELQANHMYPKFYRLFFNKIGFFVG